MPNPTPTAFVPYHAFDDLVQRGTRAGQPVAAAVTPGTLYNVTDEQKVERSNGLVWQSYSASAVLPSNLAYTDVSNAWTAPQIFPSASGFVNNNMLVRWRDSTSPVGSSAWRTVAYGGGEWSLETMSDDFTTIQARPFLLARNGGLTLTGGGYLQTGGPIRSQGANASLYLYDTGQPANVRQWRLMSQAQNLRFYRQNDDESGFVSAMELTQAAHMMVAGRLQVGSTAGISASYPALRNTGAQMDCVLGDVSNWAAFQCLSVYAVSTSNSLGDLTCRGGTNFQNGVNVTAGGLTVAGAANLNLGCTVMNNHLWTGYYIYPGAVTNPNVVQSTWYLASHSSYGLYTNTGLYCAGDVWAAGVSVTGALAGKHPLLVKTHGPITQVYGTQYHMYTSLTQGTCPAGGTGTAAGGWSTAANRNAAIDCINAAKDDIANIKQVLNHVIGALKGCGVLAT